MRNFTLATLTLLALLATACYLSRSAVAADDAKSAAAPSDAKPWLEFPAAKGPGAGKRVVLVSGDDEYRSEEALPQLAKILARHGFNCTVLFAIDPKTGEINPSHQTNIPGLAALDNADLLILFTRFRNLPDDQMKHIADYVDSGKPIIGLRTATHAFQLPAGSKYASYSWQDKATDGGFGRQVFGETWINHHGHHGKESTRGVIAPGAEQHPILRGVREIWGKTDVYGIRLPQPAGIEPLVLGQVLAGMSPADKPVAGKKNDPMMPIAWTLPYKSASGKEARVFVSTMASSQDLENNGLRRLLVNATYWALGLENEITPTSNIDIIGPYNPSPFKFDGYKKGVKPADLR